MSRTINIFAVDENAAKRQARAKTDVVGTFRSGYQAQGRPMSLTEWRVTSGEKDVVERLGEEYGGDEPKQWETKSEEVWEVFTKAAAIEVDVVNYSSEFVLWGQGGKLIRSCDGAERKDGRPCECTGSMQDRKEAAQDGVGCKPNIRFVFRIPSLGFSDDEFFRFSTGSWTMLSDMPDWQDVLAEATSDAPVKARISLEPITTKAGRTFTKPTVELL